MGRRKIGKQNRKNGRIKKLVRTKSSPKKLLWVKSAKKIVRGKIGNQKWQATKSKKKLVVRGKIEKER